MRPRRSRWPPQWSGSCRPWPDEHARVRHPIRILLAVLAVLVVGIAVWSVADRTDPAGSSADAPEVTQAPSPAPTQATKEATRKPSPIAARPSSKPTREPTHKARPLRSITIALDPGHQLGNRLFPRETNALVPAGGFEKPCNTTGTATAGGVPEATVTFELAKAVEKRLEALGAKVRVTRNANSDGQWGPCVDARGRFGKRVGAQAMISLHADGASAQDRGFHVIAPTRRTPWTADIAGPSLRLARSLRNAMVASGLAPSNYTGEGTGLNVRDDLGTLNLSDVPVAMVEIGNMRNSGDADQMTSTSGRARQADALVRGIRTFLGR
jgi:N-acetylmuramoyl-L-alanine amidase